jgi:hypothetical protein
MKENKSAEKSKNDKQAFVNEYVFEGLLREAS